MTAVVAAFIAAVGHVAEENVSVLPDVIQSTPLSEVWLACFNINSYSKRLSVSENTKVDLTQSHTNE